MIIKVILYFAVSVAVVAALIFLPAGFIFWQGAVFLAVLFIPFAIAAIYLMIKDPALIERRLRFREKTKDQKKIIPFAQAFLLIGFILPGLDQRLGWTIVPPWLVILSDILVLLGYGIIFLVFRENTYTSRIVEVEKGQKVISTGPYSIVRHPMS